MQTSLPPPIDLAQEWATDMVAVGASGDMADAVYGMIIEYYGQSGRHYHGIGHLQALFGLLAQHVPQAPGAATRLAVWWHDVIYEALSGDNEAKSGELARAHLTQLGAPTALMERVCALIIATKNHFAAPSFGEDDVFLDADIAILGAPDDVYRRYTQQVRAEYAMVPTQRFNLGRVGFLKSASAFPRLFKTDVFEAIYGPQARINMAQELADLEQAKGGAD
jgi:predicted metal-dependent HD superfamily phosphohydrolase